MNERLDTACKSLIPDTESILVDVIEQLNEIKEHLEEKGLSVHIEENKLNEEPYAKISVTLDEGYEFCYTVKHIRLILNTSSELFECKYLSSSLDNQFPFLNGESCERILEDFACSFE